MKPAWLSVLSRDHIDLAIDVDRQTRIRILERPGRWMPAVELEALSAELRSVAAETPGQGELTYGIFAGTADAFDDKIVTIVYDRKSGAPIAFNALALMALELAGRPVTVLHLGLVMIAPEARSRGLSWVLYGLTCFLLFVRNQLRPLWISSVTQVPAVVGMVSETFSGAYPDPKAGHRRSFRQLLLARQIMENHRGVFGVGDEATFDEDRFTIENAYTGGSDGLKKTFDDTTQHRDAVYNDFCRDTLDYGRGDDVLQLAQIDLAAARRYLVRSVPPGKLFGLALAGGFLVVQRLALPLIYWLDTTRYWGILRPRRAEDQ